MPIRYLHSGDFWRGVQKRRMPEFPTPATPAPALLSTPFWEDCMPRCEPSPKPNTQRGSPRTLNPIAHAGKRTNDRFRWYLSHSRVNLNACATGPRRVRKAWHIVNLRQGPPKDPTRCLGRAVYTAGGARLAKMVVPERTMHRRSIAGKKRHKRHSRNIPTRSGRTTLHVAGQALAPDWRSNYRRRLSFHPLPIFHIVLAG